MSRPCLNFEWNNLFQKILPLKDVTEAILALRRNGYSIQLPPYSQDRVLLPAHPHQAGQPHPPAGGWGPAEMDNRLEFGAGSI